jgi:hypothetical protein
MLRAIGVGQKKKLIKKIEQHDKKMEFSLDIVFKLLILVAESKNISFIILM